MNEKVLVEIRSGEGGADAKDLVGVQFSVYEQACQRRAL